MLSRRQLRIKVVKSLYGLLQRNDSDLRKSKSELLLSVDTAYDLYVYMLAFAPMVCDYAQQRIEIGLNKHYPTFEEKNPNYRFARNSVAQRISESKNIADYMKRRKLVWESDDELAKQVWGAMQGMEFYEKYMHSEKCTLKDDAEVLVQMYAQCLADNSLLDMLLEMKSVMWDDDLQYALVDVTRTLRSVKGTGEDITLEPKLKSEEDVQFAQTLLEKAFGEYAENLDTIDRNLANWDIERIALMDNIIMSVALSEAKNFPDIPVKVTINEYLEIAKCYSDSSASHFINGVLDKVIQQLRQEGRIVKFGKGLVE